MSTTTRKTADSVKTGLQIEADHPKLTAAADKSLQEKDTDDLVHERENDFTAVSAAQDLDEVVHEQGSLTSAKEAEDFLTEEEDMDDLVHRHANEDADYER